MHDAGAVLFNVQPSSTSRSLLIASFICWLSIAHQFHTVDLCTTSDTISQSINQSKQIYIAPYVASKTEAHNGRGCAAECSRLL